MKAGSSKTLVQRGHWGLGAWLLLGSNVPASIATATPAHPLFEPATRCVACHNGLVTTRGEDVSLGNAWHPTMMANAARDPYWQAGVRRETIEHPTLGAEIQDECSKCHMPMATAAAHATGDTGKVFAHFDTSNASASATDTALARDGVSCSLCHQIQATGLGQRRSLVGGFVIDTHTQTGNRQEFGPYSVDLGRAQLMRSASHMLPTRATHLGSSELCATCHTLYTHALAPNARVVGELPEQVPYQEWLHSDYRTTRSCQACHMPALAEPVSISSVAGQARPLFLRHDFVGGNFFAQDVFARFGSELFVDTAPAQFELAALRTRAHLEGEAATLNLECTTLTEGRLRATVTINNRTGHKLPTAYPSRRAWLHVTIRSAGGAVLFESGALRDDGSIVGNDNDADPSRFEPHYTRIERGSEVAIYESILGRPDGRVTTGLLTADRYLKDNRLLPLGFDKATAPAEVAVHGEAAQDPDFQGGADRVAYEVSLGDHVGNLSVAAELLYQPIAFRWAENLRNFSAFEPQRFARYYSALSRRSATVLAKVQTVVR
jgi:hypothetical protein